MHHIPATRWCLIGVLLVVAQNGDAATLIVPDQFAGIQLAIDATQDGDTVLVRAGTYVENINFVERPIAVITESGPAMTVIDGSSAPESVVQMSGLTGASIEGFTLTGGSGSGAEIGVTRGGGIWVLPDVSTNVGAMIRANWIQGNEMEGGHGAGIYVGGVATIIGNRICNNVILDTAGGGGGINVSVVPGTRITIQGNEIFNNKVFSPTFESSKCGGIWFGGLANISENVIACNWAYKLVGLWGSGTLGDAASTIERNTIVFNLVIDHDPDEVAGAAVGFVPAQPLEFFANSVFGNFGVGVWCSGKGPYELRCNNVWGNLPNFPDGDPCESLIGVDGNISSDPMFGGDLDCTCATGQADDFCVQAGSPQLPENSPPECDQIGAQGACPPIGVRDVDSSSPARLRALPAFPNPFSQRTTIAVQIPRDAEVEIAIFDVVGRRVRTLREGWMLAGDQVFEWNGRDEVGRRAASGGYIARIQVGGQELTRALLLVR